MLVAEETTSETKEVDISHFRDIVGDEVMSFVFENAPRKIAARVVKALDHFARASTLIEIDEEMGAIRLIAAEEELVVAIFECLKLKDMHFPEHKDFVRKFKNHVVKLTFYPVLAQFRFILSDMIQNGFTLQGLEHAINWSIKPIFERDRLMLVILDADRKKIIQINPLAIAITRDQTNDVRGS